MHWELQSFELDTRPGSRKVFTYEVALKGRDGTPQVTFRGDGVHANGGIVLLNHEDEIRALLDGTPVNAQQLVEHLQVCVRTRAEKLLLRRMALPRPDSDPTPALRYPAR